MAKRPTIAIVGPGRLGSALAVALTRAGYRIAEIVSRNNKASVSRARRLAKRVRARPMSEGDSCFNAGLIWLCVPDREIAPLARRFAERIRWKGKTVFHSSGALPSDELRWLHEQGAAIASVHPLMTFVSGSVPSLKGVPFAIEGDAGANRVARRIVRDLGADPFSIRKKDKVAYHAWGAFASPLLVALLATAERVAMAAGVSRVQARKRMLPILRQTIANYDAFGAGKALTGPLVRGDDAVVRKHLQTLAGVQGAGPVYLALADSVLEHLSTRNRKQMKRTLAALRTPSLGAVEIGDKVRVKKVRPGLKQGRLRTKSLFIRCVGKVFPVAGFEKGLIELEVGRLAGVSATVHSIWIEPEFLERVER